ncbi:MAG: hypothetical protein E5V63_13310 [Mesorhizobium sp.]|nr:MAG: hypothetical protein E5V63_13310 [Mesorhizobium sp.]
MPDRRAEVFGKWPLSHQLPLLLDRAVNHIGHDTPMRMTKSHLKPRIKFGIINLLALREGRKSAVVPHDRLTMLQAPIRIASISE